MKNSAKTGPYLKTSVQLRTRAFFTLGVAAIAWLALGTPTTGIHLKSVPLPTWVVTAVTTAFSALVIALDAQLGPNAKATLVFWRRRDPLPSSRAFERANLDTDTRIDRERLREVVGGTFPRSAKDQNATWYRLFKSLGEDSAVQGIHTDYLLLRDLSWLNIVLCALALVNLALWPLSRELLAFGALAFALLYLIFRRAAAERGTRLVNQVLATASAAPLVKATEG